ncbi:adenylate kinase family enzyme [Halanaerobium saccharolyticum]|jgi:adenylate kinase family enzyme|uniref:Adenylate kinase family enzyme n=1 Tax=Halanaerobium saccharolyticum TaxID=43595 RepID=A0A2T5RGM9_9FIRM|nr:AAA family ATPase [Halanaerobium saccharolyticum]PTV93936.1 adenylate kinase family enzyme [Halanaerobium saccharolyticum]TDP93092.1 adenylate kinase family enzyme [Halanaerobium saccharolyticum]
MIKHIHILGPSGSGTTTVAKVLSKKLNLAHFDADNYFWKPTDPPYQHLRSIEERRRLLKEDLKNESRWIISGSFCGWGDIFMDDFDLVIYLWTPINVRLRRLKSREQQRFGSAVLPGGKMFERHQKFLDSAARYDYDQTEFRNKRTHEEWMQKLDCPIIKIEGEKTVKEIVSIIEEKIEKLES